MKEPVYTPTESALTALSRMTIDEFADLIAQKVAAGATSSLSSTLKPFLTIEDVADMLHLGKRKIDMMIQDGTIPPPLLGGGSGSRRIWSREQFNDLLQAS